MTYGLRTSRVTLLEPKGRYTDGKVTPGTQPGDDVRAHGHF